MGPDRPDLQQALVRYIVEEQGLDRSNFSNIDQLCRAVLKEDRPRRPSIKPILLPYQSLGGLFKGRAEFIRRLHQSLTDVAAGRAAIISHALYGLGGIGKTRAAVEYAWEHREEYTALLFVIAETAETLRRNLAALAGPLILQEYEATEEQRLRAVLEWLKANPGWLLILDNVDTPQALTEAEKLVGQLAGGQVLMTSRLANFPADVRPLDLDLLSADDAADFLLERTAEGRRAAADDGAKARELAVDDLGGLALALEHAGAYIVRHRASFGQYRVLWQNNRDKVIGWSDPTVTHYPRAVAVTWQTSVAQLTEPARHLLERLAWLASEPVPEFLLDVPVPETESGELREALADLAAYSLATRELNEPRFSVHRLVQDVTRRSLDADTSHRRLVEALGWINDAFTGDPQDVHTWSRLDPLLPHTQDVTRYADASRITTPTARLMGALGNLFHSKALHAEAEFLCRRALTVTEINLGPDHPEVASPLNNLGSLLRATNRPAEAEPLMRRALAIAEKSFGRDLRVSIALSNLGELLLAASRFAEAEPLLRRALRIDENSLGPDHPNVAGYLINLGELLRDTNRPAAAEQLMRRALAISEKALGPNHPSVARALNNLGVLLRNTNRLPEAERLIGRALQIDKERHGSDHPSVAVDLSNLGELLLATDRFAEAEPLLRRALRINENSLGPDHPNVAACLINLGALLRRTNRGGKADTPCSGH
jgi:tetratricopeptide (TPR) repeat protein